MKKICVLFTVIVILLYSSVALAYSYQKHLNDDPNYVLSNAHMGVASYIKKTL